MTNLVHYNDRLTDFEKTQVERLKRIINRQLENELVEYWNIGEIVCKIYEQAEEFIKKHGKEAADAAGMTGPRRVQLVARELGVNPKTLMDSMRVVERWETKERFLDFLKAAKSPDGKLLTFAHIKELSRFDDDEFVKQQAKKAAEKGMSARELQLQLKNLSGKGKQRGPGRSPKTPSNVTSCLLDIKSSLTTVYRKATMVWFGNKYNLLDALNEIKPETYLENTQLYDKITDTIELMQNVIQTLQQYLEDLSNYIEEVAYVFDNKDRIDEAEISDVSEDLYDQDKEVSIDSDDMGLE